MLSVDRWLSINKGEMTNTIGTACSLEMLAEEASELAQAALKMARVIRGTNKTPVTAGEAYNNLVEEFTDVCMCGWDLEIYTDRTQMRDKMIRFHERNKNE